jgi:hypothetical protein
MADEHLFVANLNSGGPMERYVTSQTTQIKVMVGPQSFVPVTEGAGWASALDCRVGA